MKAKLIVEGHEFDIEILDPKLQELVSPHRKTGYERVKSDPYYSACRDGKIEIFTSHNEFDNEVYESGNYYSDKNVAENNARADRLMRQLRRFAVEHRTNELDWNNHNSFKFFIAYDFGKFDIDFDITYKMHGVIYFNSRETAELAVEAFRNELIWYFTEYKDSL